MKQEHFEELNENLDIDTPDDYVVIDHAVEIKKQLKAVRTSISYNGGGDLVEDYRVARNTLTNLIDSGMDALGDALTLAKTDPQPRAFEVSAALIKTIADISKDLISLQKQMKEITTPTEQNNTEEQDDTINLSPSDILESLR